MLRNVVVALMVLSAIPAVLSVLLHSLTPWNRTPFGRHLMAFASVIAAVLVTWTLGLMFRFPDWFAFARIGIFAAVPVVLWWRVGLQWYALRHFRDRRR